MSQSMIKAETSVRADIRILCMLIVMFCFMLYGHTLSYDITWLDDYYWLVSGKEFLSDFSNWHKLFFTDVFFSLNGGEFYRPLLSFTFIADVLLNGSGFFFSHFINLLLHSAASVLFFLLLTEFSYSEYVSAAAALIFAAHPASATAVAWIPGRNESLLAVFSFLSIISLLKFINGRRSASLFFYGLFLLMALFSKESAVALPFTAAFLFFAKTEDKDKKTVRSFICCSIIPLVIWALMRCSASITGSDLSVFKTVRNFLYIPILAGHVLFPFDTVAAAPYNGLQHDYLYLIIACICFAVFMVKLFSETVYARKINIVFGSVWFILFLLPTFIASDRATAVSFFSEHRLYLPMAGLILAVLQVIMSCGHKQFFLTLSFIFLLFLASVSVCHVYSYKNNFVFWQSMVRKYYFVPKYVRNMAWQEKHRRLYGSAVFYYKKNLELVPDDYESHLNLFDIYLKNNNLSSADEEYQNILRLNPDHEKVRQDIRQLQDNKAVNVPVSY